MQAWHDNENKAYQALVLALGFATLLLTKQTGIMLLPLVFALYVVKLALFDAHGAGEWSCAKLFAVACAAVLASVLVWYSFNLFVDAHVATDSHQSYSGFRVARVIDAFKPERFLPRRFFCMRFSARFRLFLLLQSFLGWCLCWREAGKVLSSSAKCGWQGTSWCFRH